MRPLSAVLAACALCAAPVALQAQPFPQQPEPPNVRSIPPYWRPQPGPPGAYRHRPHNRTTSAPYPVVIDSSVIDRFLALPAPAPAPKRTRAARSNYGQDVFETHSTDDAK